MSTEHRGYTTEKCPECSTKGIAQTRHRLIEPPNHKTGTALIRECMRCKQNTQEEHFVDELEE